MSALRVVVVGAGLAGLAAAETLRAGGAEVVVFEALDRVGGRVWSDRFPSGAVFERGGEFVTRGYETLERYAAELGLELAGMGIRYPERRLSPDPGLVRSEVVAAAGAAESAARADPSRPALDVLRETVADERIAELLAARVQSSRAYPVEELDASFLLDLTALVDDAETRRIGGGNQLVAERLAARQERLHLGDAVRRVVDTGAGVAVSSDGGELTADACVVAVPVPAVRALDLPAPAAYAAVRMSTAAKLAAPLSAPAAPDAVMSAAERWWAYSTGDAVGAWAGAAPVVELVGARDGAWIDRVERLLPGLPVERDAAVVTVWEEAYSVLPHALDGAPAGLEGAGRIVFAGEHTARDWAATMEGALRSGERAARALLELRP
ncbi:MAG TPA: FAD-dependent oxidoreductase [Gaiellaceae bacterium]|nr:FAD-dependent oxidoreductase [Gaiellaceae bacterium]